LDNIRNYKRCEVVGTGEFNIRSSHKSHTLEVIDISASGVRILTRSELEENAEIDMNIRFSAFIIDFFINVKGEIKKKSNNGSSFEYAVKFKDLSQNKKVEIDEIVGRICSTHNIGGE